MPQNADPCARCGHRYLDHAPNWMVTPALSPCTECDCPEFVEPQLSDGRIQRSMTVQQWYRYRFGIHDHPVKWPLNMTRRAHASCVKVWVEVQHPDGEIAR